MSYSVGKFGPTLAPEPHGKQRKRDLYGNNKTVLVPTCWWSDWIHFCWKNETPRKHHGSKCTRTFGNFVPTNLAERNIAFRYISCQNFCECLSYKWLIQLSCTSDIFMNHTALKTHLTFKCWLGVVLVYNELENSIFRMLRLYVKASEKQTNKQKEEIPLNSKFRITTTVMGMLS